MEGGYGDYNKGYGGAGDYNRGEYKAVKVYVQMSYLHVLISLFIL